MSQCGKTTIVLGEKYQDKVTGYVGIATTVTHHLAGCNRVGLQGPADKDNKVPEVQWTDEPMLQYIAGTTVKPTSGMGAG